MNRQVPINLSCTDALNSIGENIIIADKEFKISWMNIEAIKTLSVVAPFYHLENAEEMIGLNMDFFHKRPGHQQQIMNHLSESHRARINIKGVLDADIVISPIKCEQNPEDLEGYMVMLMDITSQAEEQKKREQLIRELSVPILNVWDKTIALTLIGQLDVDRGEMVIATVLEECVSKGIEFVILSLAGIKSFDDSIRANLQKLYDCLKLIGVQCIIVGIKPKLALNIIELNNSLTFRDANAALKYIMKHQNMKLAQI